MYGLTNDALALGLVGLLQFLPVLILTLPAGHFVDKWNRARIITGCLIAQAVLATLLVAGAATNTLSKDLLLLASLGLGASRAFQMPAVQAFVPGTVPSSLLTWAMAAASTSSQMSVILGAMTLDVFAVLFGSAVALLPIYAKDILHVGPAGLGWLHAGPAIGAFSMALYLVHHPMKSRIGRTLLICVGLYGLATIVFGVSTSFMLSMAALIMTCACDMVSVVIRQTLVQLETPDDMCGRVSAVNSMFIGASNQLGEFESGAAAALIGPVGAVAL